MKYSISQTQLVLLIICLTVASVFGINQYIYGHWNHYNTIPFLKDFLQPELYPGDILVEQRQFFFTYFFHFLELPISIFNIEIPTLFFVLYCISIVFTFWGVYKLTFTLFENQEAAFLSIIFFAFTFPTIGYVQSWESLFYERTLSLPLLLFSIVFFLKDRLYLANALQGLAFMVHPLSALFVIVFTWLAHIFKHKKLRPLDLTAIVVLVLFISPVLYLKIKNGTGEGMFGVNQEWLEIMRLRNFHHAFPFTFDLDLYLKSAGVIIAFVWMLKSLKLDASLKRWFWGALSAILLLLLIGTIFTEIIPLKIVIQFQFFRSFRFLIYLTLALWAYTIVNGSTRILVISTVFLLPLYFDGQLSKFAGFVAVLLSSLVLFRFKSSLLKPIYRLYAISLIYCLLGLSAYFMRGNFTIQNQQKPTWLAVQEWAKENTSNKSLFIVPPKEWGFRTESERSIYGDWDDGTKAFFSTEYGLEWLRRMKMLNCPNPDQLVSDFKANTLSDFQSIKTEQETQLDYEAYYLVCYSDMLIKAPVSFENEDFKVYELK